jgi:SAM-dependent methyltransferase
MNTKLQHAIEWDDTKVSRLWDYYSRTPPYSEIYFSKLFGDQMLRLSGLPPGDALDVLDFGCGPGFIWDHLLHLGAKWRYTALDFSPDSVDKARSRGRGHPQFTGAHHVTQLPADLPAGRYDAVFLFEVVEHLNDAYLEGTIKEAYRLLRPGGVVVISTPNEEDLGESTRFCPECGAIFHEWQHVRTWSVLSLSAYMKTHGLARRHVVTLDFRARTSMSRLIKLARRLLHGKHSEPHMIAVFQKA